MSPHDKMVSVRSLFGAAALMVTTVMAAATPVQIAAGLNSITEIALELQIPAQSLTVVNTPLIIIKRRAQHPHQRYRPDA